MIGSCRHRPESATVILWKNLSSFFVSWAVRLHDRVAGSRRSR